MLLKNAAQRQTKPSKSIKHLVIFTKCKESKLIANESFLDCPQGEMAREVCSIVCKKCHTTSNLDFVLLFYEDTYDAQLCYKVKNEAINWTHTEEYPRLHRL